MAVNNMPDKSEQGYERMGKRKLFNRIPKAQPVGGASSTQPVGRASSAVGGASSTQPVGGASSAEVQGMNTRQIQAQQARRSQTQQIQAQGQAGQSVQPQQGATRQGDPRQSVQRDAVQGDPRQSVQRDAVQGDQRQGDPRQSVQRDAVQGDPGQSAQAVKRPSRNGGNVGARMHIHDQTPSRRRSAKEAKKIDPNAPEIKRSAKRAQEYKIKKKKKGISKKMIAYALIFLLVFSAVCGIIAGAFYSNLVEVAPSEYEGLKLKMCLSHEIKDVKSVYVDTTQYVRDGKIYVNMTAISELFGFIMTGDRKAVRFITNEDTAETVCFEIGSPFAEINGTVVRLSGETFNSKGFLFVPADFFNEYVVGIDVTLTEERERPLLTVVRNTTRNEAGHFDSAEVEFTLKKTDTCPSISEFGLSQEIKDKCTFITVIPGVTDQTTPQN